MRHSLTAIASLLALGACATFGGAPPSLSPVEVHLLAINDFHGNLEPPSGGARIFNYEDPSKPTFVPAGGSARLASAIAQLSRQPNSIMVAAGDIIGASPLLSSLFHDEPTIEAMSKMGLAITSVGNHEFDEGWKELHRMQAGGCHPVDGCQGPAPFKGAQFEYLAASTYLETGETLFPPYAIREFEGVKVGFIGLTLEGTPDILTPAARAGISFRNEAETVNALVPKLQAQGVQSIVVLIHEGGYAGQSLDDCHGLTGTIASIVPKFDKAVDVVVTGHTNGIYICTLDGRLVTGAGAYGTRVTDIKLMIDPKTGDVIGKSARDIPIRLDAFPADQAQLDLIAAYKAKAEPLMIRPVGRIAAAITRTATAGESALGDLIADAMLEAARGQDPKIEIAFMNPGGIRSDLPFKDGGQVTFGDIFTVQPFGNQLVSLDLTGAQIEAALKQQYHPTGGLNILQVSEGFSFAWRQQAGQPIEIVPGSITLNGKPLAPTQTYRVVTNNFLAGGGDNFVAFKDGKPNGVVGGDIDAFEAYVKAHSPIAGAVKGRITRTQ